MRASKERRNKVRGYGAKAKANANANAKAEASLVSRGETARERGNKVR